MTLLLHELLPGPPAANPIELFVALCNPQNRHRRLREWLGLDYHPDPHGQPTVPNRSISISHTATLLALAMRTRGRIGIDIETIPAPANLNPLPQGLAPSEESLLLLLPPADRPNLFTRLWTAKEALSKALGLGHTIDLAQIELHPDPQTTTFASLYQNPTLAQGWIILHRPLQTPTPALLTIAYDGFLRSS